MLVYVAKSGDKRKVGITHDLDGRASTYATHNPDFELVPVIENLNDWHARFAERIAHQILDCVGNEWGEWSDAELKLAIDAARECVQTVATAEFNICMGKLRALKDRVDPRTLIEQYPETKEDARYVAGMLLEMVSARQRNEMWRRQLG